MFLQTLYIKSWELLFYKLETDISWKLNEHGIITQILKSGRGQNLEVHLESFLMRLLQKRLWMTACRRLGGEGNFELF